MATFDKRRFLNVFLTLLISLPIISLSTSGFTKGNNPRITLKQIEVTEDNDKVKITMLTNHEVGEYDVLPDTYNMALVINLYDTKCTPEKINVEKDGIIDIQSIQKDMTTTQITISLVSLVDYNIIKIKKGLELSWDNPYNDYQILGITTEPSPDGLWIITSFSSRPQYRYFELSNPPRLVIDCLNAICKNQELGEISPITGISITQKQIKPVRIARIILGFEEPLPFDLITEGQKILVKLKAVKSTKEVLIQEIKKEEVALSQEEIPVAKKDIPMKKEIPSPVSSENIEVEVIKEGTVSLISQLFEEDIPVKNKKIVKRTVLKKEKVLVPKEPEGTPSTKEDLLLSMDFKDADIIDLLRLMAYKANVSIIPDPDVVGLVTIKIDNIQWEKALALILDVHGYGYIRQDDIIRVAKKEKIAQLLETRVYVLNYAKAAIMIPTLTPLLQAPGGRISFDERTNSIIVTNPPNSFEDIERLIKTLDTIVPQVMIEAKIVKIRTSVSNDLGIDWNVDDGGGVTAGLTLGTKPSPWFRYAKTIDNIQLTAQLNALISRKEAKILSNPKVICLDNTSANVISGQEIPYFTVSESTTGSQYTVEFKQAGITLNVVPKITPNNDVLLRIKPEVSKIAGWMTGIGGSAIPYFDTESVETNVLVKNGETIVVGGVIDEVEYMTREKVPFLSTLPIINGFFKNKTSSTDRTELLMFLTIEVLR